MAAMSSSEAREKLMELDSRRKSLEEELKLVLLAVETKLFLELVLCSILTQI